MQQLTLFQEEQKTQRKQHQPKVSHGASKLTRAKLSRLDYEMECPLSFVAADGHCHRCVFFDGGEMDLSTSPPQVTMRCIAGQYTGPQFGYKPGHIHQGWKSTVAWIEKVFQDGVEVLSQ